jgi:hypothetical protein
MPPLMLPHFFRFLSLSFAFIRFSYLLAFIISLLLLLPLLITLFRHYYFAIFAIIYSAIISMLLRHYADISLSLCFIFIHRLLIISPYFSLRHFRRHATPFHFAAASASIFIFAIISLLSLRHCHYCHYFAAIISSLSLRYFRHIFHISPLIDTIIIAIFAFIIAATLYLGYIIDFAAITPLFHYHYRHFHFAFFIFAFYYAMPLLLITPLAAAIISDTFIIFDYFRLRAADFRYFAMPFYFRFR